MAITAYDLMQFSGTTLGELSPGEEWNESERTYIRAKLNAIIDNANIQEEMATAATVATVALVNGTQSYALGTRVVKIVSAEVQQSSGSTMPLKIVNAQEWNAIIDRDALSAYPQSLFYDRGFTTGTIYLSPIPTGGTLTYVAWLGQPTFATSGSSTTLLPGYERYLVTQLAIEIAPFFKSEVPPSVISANKEAKDEIRKLNASLWGVTPTAEGSGVA
jgi:hypothetical protein